MFTHFSTWNFLTAEILKNGNAVSTRVPGFKILWIFKVLPFSVFN